MRSVGSLALLFLGVTIIFLARLFQRVKKKDDQLREIHKRKEEGE